MTAKQGLIFLISTWTIVLSSCDGLRPGSVEENGAGSADSTLSDTPKVTDKAVLLTNVDQLRLRKYCDLKSTMLTTFDENTPLYFLNEKTDFQDKIGKHKGPWLHVSSVDGSQKGWVFGAEFFVSWLIEEHELDSLNTINKDIRLFDNLNRGELSKLTGANWDSRVQGTRYSGYYEYNIGDDPQIINGRVEIRARVFDSETRKVQYIPCELKVVDGMPVTEVTCFEPTANSGE